MSKNKYVLVVLVVFGTVVFATADEQGCEGPNLTTLWIEQKLDHFNESDFRIWKMRCMANDEFYNSGGPLFVHVSESEINVDFIEYGHIHDMAKEHGGYLVVTETRFYGESRPVADLSSTNLKYLNVDQILADLAEVIRTTKANTPGMKNSKVILCGSYYGGSYVTWFKQRYPELADGVWASSALLEVKHNFYEYREEAGQAIKMIGGSECYNRTKRAFDELQSMIDNNRTAEVMTKFHVCDSIRFDNWLDVSTLFRGIQTFFIYLPHAYSLIPEYCGLITSASSDIDAIAATTFKYFNPNETNENCLDFSYSSYLKEHQSTSFDINIDTTKGSFISLIVGESNSLRPYFYQQCNELFSFITSDSPNQPFGTKPSLEFFTTFCKNVYGTEYTIESVERKIRGFNERFGGRNPKVNNVFFTYGQYDPYRRLGIEDEGKATIVLNQGIGGDMNKDVNNENVKTVREAVSSFVRGVLKQHTE